MRRSKVLGVIGTDPGAHTVSTRSPSGRRRAAARALDRHSPMPLWAQLHDDLNRRLALGAFDDAFPGELDLVAEYEVSRHTVREALRRLRERGVLDVARGRATQVRRGIEQPLGTLYSLFREVEARGMRQTSTVLAQELTRDAAVADRLQLPDGSELFRLERVRLADGEPLAHDQVWLPAHLARDLVEVDFTRTALYDELSARSGVIPTDGTEQITAVVPDEGERELLALPSGVACLRIERQGRRAGAVVEVRETLIRGDRYTLLAGWSGAGAGSVTARPA